jgi:UDP-N-acetyl-D-mannosaminuronate dehydrogenase
MKVAMIGCGKLGLPCAEVMSKHYDIVGYDVVKDPWRSLPQFEGCTIIHYGNTQ